MSTYLLVAYPGRAEVAELARSVAQRVLASGHRVWMRDAAQQGFPELDNDGTPAETTAAIALGGDGTMLHTVHLLDGAPVPILGINLGNLGYLTELEPEQVEAGVDRLLRGPTAGEWFLDTRMMLDVDTTTAAGESLPTLRALNESVVEKRVTGHTVNLLARIDGEPFTSYAADGLIVSTPTGSTAYSMSARGPIVSPKHRAVLLTPVAPHMLFDRTIVLDPSETVEIEVVGQREAALAVDGRFITDLQPGAVVTCTPSAATAQFVRFGGTAYHQILKTKFGLTDR